MNKAMTLAQAMDLPSVVDIVTAGRMLGIGRTKAQELARAGQWPTPLLRLGSSYRVPTAALLRLLEISPYSSEAGASTPAIALAGSTATTAQETR
jgi:hypothetical protein